MAIDKKLLNILCCPSTKTPLEMLDKATLSSLNDAISQGTVHYSDGSKVEQALDEGLVTKSRELIYRVDDGIPVLLENMSIAVADLDSSAQS